MRKFIVLILMCVSLSLVGCNKTCPDVEPCPSVSNTDTKPDVPSEPILPPVITEDEKPNNPGEPINPKLLKPSDKGWFYSAYVMENFNKYPNLVKYNKSGKYWNAFLYGMARAESGLNPKAIYWEKTMRSSTTSRKGYFKRKGKTYKYLSEGLFQLSVSDGWYRPKHCKFDESDLGKKELDSTKTIFVPKKQIDCTLHIIDWLITKYKTPFTNKGNYWAVLMPRKTSGHARFNKYFKLKLNE